MNNSTIFVIELFNSSIQYVCFGSVAIVANLLILFVLLHNVKYLKKSAFVTGLAIGDLVNGISLVATGAMRLVQEINHMSAVMVHPSYCWKILLTPIILTGNQIPGIMFFLVGTERFIAVYHYDWYYLKWTNKLAWTLTFGAYIVCLISVLASFGIAFSYSSSSVTPIACLTSSIVGPTYSAYNYGIDIIGGTVAALATIIAMVIFSKKKARVSCETNVSASVKLHVRKQWQLSRIAFCLAVVDFGFLVIPSTMITLSGGFGVNFNIRIDTLNSWSLQLVCFRSIMNVIIYLFINQEFRSATKLAFGFKNNGQNLFLSTMSPVVKPNPVF